MKDQLPKTILTRIENDTPLLVSLKQNELIISYPVMQNNSEEALLHLLQAGSTIIQLAKQTVKGVQNYLYRLRNITLNATRLENGPKERLELEKDFSVTIYRLDNLVRRAKFAGIAFMTGTEGTTTRLLTSNEAKIIAISLAKQNHFTEGIYKVRLSVTEAYPHRFCLTLIKDKQIISNETLKTDILVKNQVIQIAGINFAFDDLNTNDLLEAKIGARNETQLLQVKLTAPLPPNRYQLGLQQTPSGFEVSLGRFTNRIQGHYAEVGGLSLEFSKNFLNHIEPENIAISDVYVQHQTLESSFVIGNWLLPLKMRLLLPAEDFELELIPLLSQALLADAFGAYKSISDLHVGKGFDPATNLEVIETANLQLNNYDKHLTKELHRLQNQFFSKLTKNNFYSPSQYLTTIQTKLDYINAKLITKDYLT